ncbi:DUF2318 domain-containing protein [Geopsychrobacter electrodiphilus]|uniref:DUF2318 domain-containing protein n=1 Tax=Geopsychrobacter electrodiphilus TaxID=225196 RepID=UPI000363F77E|nr:DUF2318 domain-containing protein [Geopsychrobacter electrodiphilus]
MSEERNRQSKKELFTKKKGSSTGKVFTLLGVLVIGAVAAWFLLGQGASDGIAAVKAENGFVNLTISDLDDGQAHFFKLATGKGDIKFFVVKSVDGVMRAAFDACDVCYREKKGYRQEGDFMVCNNCGQKFRTDLVNEVKGGCNPAPLARRVESNQILIAKADIVGGGWYFGL